MIYGITLFKDISSIELEFDVVGDKTIDVVTESQQYYDFTTSEFTKLTSKMEKVFIELKSDIENRSNLYGEMYTTFQATLKFIEILRCDLILLSGSSNKLGSKRKRIENRVICNIALLMNNYKRIQEPHITRPDLTIYIDNLIDFHNPLSDIEYLHDTAMDGVSQKRFHKRKGCFKCNCHQGDGNYDSVGLLIEENIVGNKIIECNENWRCTKDQTCTNYVVKKGSHRSLTLYKDISKGWCVKTNEIIKKVDTLVTILGNTSNYRRILKIILTYLLCLMKNMG